MLPSASALASRREERVQKAFSVDHHGPGDARLSHRATAIYGEHSDYVKGRLVQQACERSIEQEIPFRLPDCFVTRVHLSNLADRGHFILLG